jgi:DNA (cytosine-5)-methyltransferase 1
MIYGSVCSGIEAATVAWEPLGWEAAWYAEIEPFPSEVLKHYYPSIHNLGDMTKLEKHNIYKETKIDLLVGGTPCQSFSLAGLRGGLKDTRGNLALEYLKIVDKKKPQWFLWENVPGVLSSKKGRDFGTFLGGIQKLGYGFAYRVLDSQYFGVPQRRRRVFVVGYLGDWRPSAAVLFEQESLCWSSKKSKESQQESTTSIENSIREIKLPIFADVKNYTISEQAPTLTASCGISNATGPKILDDKGVRRLTLLECERLQGFPDNYTNIPGAKDGYRYKALGNSMAIPVMHWIGKRIKDAQEVQGE